MGVTSAFDAATAVTSVGDGRYEIDVHPLWSVGGRANGGYLLATATRAVISELTGPGEGPGEHPGESPRESRGDGSVHGSTATAPLTPLAVTGAFAEQVPPGRAVVEVEVFRRGRSTSVARGRVVADGVTRLEVVVTAGRVAEGPQGAQLVPGPPRPSLPPIEDCLRLPPRSPGFDIPLMSQVNERLDPATLGFALGAPSGAGVLQGYVEFEDGRPMDALGLVLAVDCFPPATFDLPGVQPGWVPTMQLSAFVRALPAPGPVVVQHRARSVGGGAVDETTDVWDSTGRLVAVGHQLAAVRLT